MEDIFAKVVGRQPSEAERVRLLSRSGDALGLRDNDAFWSVVMALEHRDSFLRAYPAQLAAETRRCIEQAREALSVAAQREATHVHRMLSEKVVQTSAEIAASSPTGRWAFIG